MGEKLLDLFVWQAPKWCTVSHAVENEIRSQTRYQYIFGLKVSKIFSTLAGFLDLPWRWGVVTCVAEILSCGTIVCIDFFPIGHHRIETAEGQEAYHIPQFGTCN